VSLNGRNILITGSTDGIGLETAIQLSRMGANIILHGRTPQRCQQAALAINKVAGTGTVEMVTADLSTSDAVRRLGAEVLAKVERLDALINNAGVYMSERIMTPDNIEYTFAVNHLAPFVLTTLLFGLLKKSAPSRIITVGSAAHQQGSMALKDLRDGSGFSPYGTYAMSKLANVLFTLELAERLKGSGVTANCLHPGVVDTKLLRKGFRMQGRSVKEGASTLVYLASATEIEHASGKYFVDRTEVEPSARARDRKTQQQLWELSESLTAQEWTPG
jgi:NAD(P)-dependent dehydrogenase (short-subunit alcohol dehydrogenase family)